MSQTTQCHAPQKCKTQYGDHPQGGICPHASIIKGGASSIIRESLKNTAKPVTEFAIQGYGHKLSKAEAWLNNGSGDPFTSIDTKTGPDANGWAREDIQVTREASDEFEAGVVLEDTYVNTDGRAMRVRSFIEISERIEDHIDRQETNGPAVGEKLIIEGDYSTYPLDVFGVVEESSWGDDAVLVDGEWDTSEVEWDLEHPVSGNYERVNTGYTVRPSFKAYEKDSLVDGILDDRQQGTDNW